jgi:putative intracellular protease/amidase
MPGLQRRPRRRCRRFLWAIGSVLLSALTFAGMFVAGALVTAHGLHRASPAAVPRTRRPTTMSRPRPATSLGRTVAGSSWHSSPEKRGPSPAPCSHPSTSSRALPLSTRTSSPLTPAPCLWKAARLLVPTYTFADVDADPVLRPDLVVVPALSKPPDGTEKARRTWVTTQHHDGARVLGVCAGSVVLGRTGVLDGMHATSHWSRITAPRHGRPAVRWVTGRRWVEEGSVITTAAVTSGVPAALHLVAELAGTTEAQRVARLHVTSAASVIFGDSPTFGCHGARCGGLQQVVGPHVQCGREGVQISLHGASRLEFGSNADPGHPRLASTAAARTHPRGLTHLEDAHERFGRAAAGSHLGQTLASAATAVRVPVRVDSPSPQSAACRSLTR